MIHSFEILNPDKTHIPWLAKVPALAKPRKFEFKPGLNILWGRNGSGKSTVLKAMARLLHCEQGGQPCVTQTSISTLVEHFRFSDKKAMQDLPKAVTLHHDGQGVRCFDPGNAVGLMGGGAAFDDDFFSMGVSNAMFKGSAGQQTMFRFDAVAGAILDKKVPKVEWKFGKNVNSTWTEYVKVAETFLKGEGEPGQPTILLDEPERSYDLPKQINVWRFIRAYSSEVQFIVASHSLYALRIPEAHYIELDEGYLTDALLCLAHLSTWAQDKPEKVSAEKLAKARKAK